MSDSVSACDTGAPRLSICIPTFDRAQFIGLAIGSVLAQSDGLPVEVVVCDNASTDNTEALVRGLMTRHAQLRYERNGVNLGADQNTLRAASHARGDYLWILGSDDAIPDGALAVVLQAIADDAPAVVMGDAVDCDIELRPTGTLKFLAGPAAEYDFARTSDRLRFLEACTMTASLFGYLSSMVFRRALWCAMPLARWSVGTAYPQVFRALDMLCKGPGRVRYLAEPIALDRRNNCSYAAEFGMVARITIDLRMARLAIDEYFSADLAMRNALRRFVRRCSGRIFLSRTRVGVPVLDELIEFFEPDDSALPALEDWPCSPDVVRLRERLQGLAAGQRLLAAEGLLHVGYRTHARAHQRPINAQAIGVDEGFSGYDGVTLPFENGTRPAILLGPLAVLPRDLPAVLRECRRVLAPAGLLALVVESDGAVGSASAAALLSAVETALGTGSFRLLHAAEVEADADGGAQIEMLLVLRGATPAAEPARPSVSAVSAASAALAAALAAQQRGDWTEVAMQAAGALAVDPQHTSARQLLGVALMQQGQSTPAIVQLTTALLQGAELPDALCNLGVAYARIGALPEAIGCFEAALRQLPGLAAALSNVQVLRALPPAQAAAQAQQFAARLADDAALAAAHARWAEVCGTPAALAA